MTKLNRRKFIGVTAAAAVPLSIPYVSSSQAGEKTTIKLGWATSNSERDFLGIAARAFKRNLETESGDFLVELYPNRQIGDEKQLAEGLRLGSVDAAILTSAAHSQIEPAFQVNDLPFLYPNEDVVFSGYDGELGAKLASKLDSKGIKLLGYLAGGYRHMLNNVRPVNVPADVEGVTYRVHSRVLIDMYNALGASPVPMAWGETMIALQRGAIDGLDMDISTTFALKIYEAVKYMSLTAHTYSSGALSMSGRRFRKLNDDQKQAVVKAGKAAAIEQRVQSILHRKEAFKALQATDLVINDVTEHEKFRQIVLPTYEKLRPDIGSDVLDLALAHTSTS